MSGGQQTSTNAAAGVPAWLKPYLTSNLSNAQNLEQTGQFTGTPTPVAPLSPLQQQGMSSIGAVNPSGVNAANSALTGLLGGQYLGAGQSQMGAASPQIASEASGALMDPSTNPYLASTYQQAAGQMQNQLASQFGTAGSNVLNSLPVQQQGLSDLANSIYGGAYATDLGATQAAQQLASGNYNTGVNSLVQGSEVAPGVTQGLLLPGQAQLAAGGTQQTQQQNQLNAPYNTLSWYSSLLGQNASPFSAQSSTTTQQPSTMQSLMGFGGLGLGLLGML